MKLQEILDRVQNILYQGVDTESQDLDLLRHDLENAIIDSSIDEDVSAEVQWRKQFSTNSSLKDTTEDTSKSINDEIEERMMRRVNFGRREEDKIKHKFNSECG
tara:strand:+ start:364 stop:675 length:312 start_codon:yes stop_codon:yes gene_type:complete